MLADEYVFLVAHRHRQLVILSIPANRSAHVPVGIKKGVSAVGNRKEFQPVAGEEHLHQRLAFLLAFGFHIIQDGCPVLVIEEKTTEHLFAAQSLVCGFTSQFCGKILGKCLHGADASFVEYIHLAHLRGCLARQGAGCGLCRIDN